MYLISQNKNIIFKIKNMNFYLYCCVCFWMGYVIVDYWLTKKNK